MSKMKFDREPASSAEIEAALQRGRTAGADFVILERQADPLTSEHEDLSLLVFADENNPLRGLFERMADAGDALRVPPAPLTRKERQRLLRREGV